MLALPLGLWLHVWLLNNKPIFKFIATILQLFVMFPVWLQSFALPYLFDGLGVRLHLGQRRDRQGLLGCWCVSLLGQSPGGGVGAQDPRQPRSPNPFWLKPTLRVSSVTFATFRSHRWPFWKKLRRDPFRKEEGRRDGKPNGTQENHFLRLK